MQAPPQCNLPSALRWHGPVPRLSDITGVMVTSSQGQFQFPRVFIRNFLVILCGIRILLLITVDLHLAVYRFYARVLYVCLLDVRTPYYTSLGRNSATYIIIIIIIIIIVVVVVVVVVVVILTLGTMCAS